MGGLTGATATVTLCMYSFIFIFKSIYVARLILYAKYYFYIKELLTLWSRRIWNLDFIPVSNIDTPPMILICCIYSCMMGLALCYINWLGKTMIWSQLSIDLCRKFWCSLHHKTMCKHKWTSCQSPSLYKIIAKGKLPCQWRYGWFFNHNIGHLDYAWILRGSI